MLQMSQQEEIKSNTEAIQYFISSFALKIGAFINIYGEFILKNHITQKYNVHGSLNYNFKCNNINKSAYIEVFLTVFDFIGGM